MNQIYNLSQTISEDKETIATLENNLSMKDIGKQVSTVARNFYLTELSKDL